MAEIVETDYNKQEEDALKDLLNHYMVIPGKIDSKYRKENNFIICNNENDFLEGGLELSLKKTQIPQVPLTLNRLMVNNNENNSWVYLKLSSEGSNYTFNLPINLNNKHNRKDVLNEHKDLFNEEIYVNSLEFNNGVLRLDYNDNKKFNYDVINNKLL